VTRVRRGRLIHLSKYQLCVNEPKILMRRKCGGRESERFRRRISSSRRILRWSTQEEAALSHILGDINPLFLRISRSTQFRRVHAPTDSPDVANSWILSGSRILHRIKPFLFGAIPCIYVWILRDLACKACASRGSRHTKLRVYKGLIQRRDRHNATRFSAPVEFSGRVCIRI